MNQAIFLVCLRPEHLTAERRAFLHQWSGGRKLVLTLDRDEIVTNLSQVEIAVGEVPRDLLAQAPGLKWHQQMGTGAEWLIRHPEAVRHPFVLTNCSDGHCVVLADHTLALMLACSRQISRFVHMKGRGTWDRSETELVPTMFELRGRTLLVVGLGSIGLEIVRRARAFGMRVLGLRARPEVPVAGVEKIVGPGELASLLPEADMVALTLPNTPKTRGMFNAEAFQIMNSSAFLFNVGRGSVIDEDALVQALREGWIAGAGLDVFSEEPLPESSPLWQAPNLILTPHVGGLHVNIFETWLEVAFDNIQRHAEGRELRNVVDKHAGY